jgi:hypothetical protein
MKFCIYRNAIYQNNFKIISLIITVDFNFPFPAFASARRSFFPSSLTLQLIFSKTKSPHKNQGDIFVNKTARIIVLCFRAYRKFAVKPVPIT